MYRLQGGVQQQQQTTASPYDFDASSNPSTLHQYSLHDHGNPPTYPMQHQHQSVPSSIYAPTTPAYNTAPPPPPNASVRASPALASSSSSAPFSRVSATAPRPAARAATAATRDPKATTRATRQPPTSRPVSPPSGAVGSASGWSESAVEDFSSLVPAPTTKAGRAAAAAAAASRKSNSCGPCKKRKLKYVLDSPPPSARALGLSTDAVLADAFFTTADVTVYSREMTFLRVLDRLQFH